LKFFTEKTEHYFKIENVYILFSHSTNKGVNIRVIALCHSTFIVSCKHKYSNR